MGFWSQRTKCPPHTPPPAVLYSRLLQVITTQSPEAGSRGSPRGCTVLSLPHFSVFPRTHFSVCWRAELWESSISALLPFSDGCQACGIAPDPFQRAREEKRCDLPWWWMWWAQAESGPCANKCTLTRAARAAMLLGEALQALWSQKQDRSVSSLSLTSLSSLLLPSLSHLSSASPSTGGLMGQHQVSRGRTSFLPSPLLGGSGARVYIYLHMKANRCKSLILASHA